jgi:hypothetical protein
MTFGKFHKSHVSNMKEFRVYGGMTPNNLVEILHGGLRNDNEPETFSLKSQSKSIVRPCVNVYQGLPLQLHQNRSFVCVGRKLLLFHLVY